MATTLEIYNWFKTAEQHIHGAYRHTGMDHLIEKTDIKWNTRFKSKAGLARTSFSKYDKNEIELGLKLWPHMTDAQRRQTAIHEAAHIITNHRFNRSCGHGREWKSVMRELGLRPDRCHSLDTFSLGISKRRGSRGRYWHPCNCPNGCTVGPVVAKRVMRVNEVWQSFFNAKHTGLYVCRRCKTPLTKEKLVRKQEKLS